MKYDITPRNDEPIEMKIVATGILVIVQTVNEEETDGDLELRLVRPLLDQLDRSGKAGALHGVDELELAGRASTDAGHLPFVGVDGIDLGLSTE
jgi:hypothetical protein